MDNLFNRLIDLATVCPDKKAVVFKGEYLTYRELCRRIASMAEQLAKEGVGQGDREYRVSRGCGLQGGPGVRRGSGIS